MPKGSVVRSSCVVVRALPLLLIGIYVLTVDGVAAENDVLPPADCDMWYGIKERTYLHGMWQLARVSEKEARIEEVRDKPLSWWTERLATKSERFPVPWDWNTGTEVPVGQKTYYGDKACPVVFGRYKNDRAEVLTIAGMYKHTITLPAIDRQSRLLLHFEWIDSETEIYLNGQLVGKHTNYYNSSSDNDLNCTEFFDVDIAAQAVEGENTLLVKVFDNGHPISNWRGPDYGGICGPVWIEQRPRVFVQDFFLVPRLASSTLQAELVLNQAPAQEMKLDIRILPWEQLKKGPHAHARPAYRFAQRIAAGARSVTCALEVPDIRQWDTEQPNLYALVICSGASVLGMERFGFREFATRGDRFLLNGKEIYLRGGTCGFQNCFSASMPIQYGKGGHVRRVMERLKRVSHFNFIRNHSGPSPKYFLALLDELGILLNEEWSIKGRALKRVKHSEYIREKTLDFIGDDGSFAGDVEERMRKMVTRGHNHPCVAFWDSGNELRVRPAVIAYGRVFYKTIKKYDRQQRPVASLGSGAHLEDYSEKMIAQDPAAYRAPTDLLDYHVYAGTLHGTSWLDIPRANKRWRDRFKLLLPDRAVPAVNGETVGVSIFGAACRPVYEQTVLARIKGKTRKERLLDFVRGDCEAKGGHYQMTNRILLLSKVGIKAFDSYAATMAARNTVVGMNVDTLRRDCDFMQGISVLLGNDRMTRDFTDPVAMQYFEAWRPGFTPVFLSLYPVRRHYQPGDQMPLRLLIHNGTLSTIDTPILEVQLLADGRPLAAVKGQVERITVNERKQIQNALVVPADAPTGECILRLTLTAQNMVIAKRDYAFSILPAPAKFAAGTRLWVWRGTQNERQRRFFRALEELGIEVQEVGRFAEHDPTHPLVFPPHSFDRQLEKDAALLRNWLTQGGRMLVLAQDRLGPLPFAEHYVVADTGMGAFFSRYKGNPFVDTIVPDHAILAGLSDEHFRNWEGKHTLYTKWIQTAAQQSVDASVIQAACWKKQGMKHGQYGMIANEAAVGKGRLVCSQMDVFGNWRDPAAQIYFRNLIAYVCAQ